MLGFYPGYATIRAKTHEAKVENNGHMSEGHTAFGNFCESKYCPLLSIQRYMERLLEMGFTLKNIANRRAVAGLLYRYI